MLPLVFAAIAFFFLLVGAVVFLICVLLPPTRRYALSAALWCAVWGPCSIAWMTFAGFALIIDAFVTRSGNADSLRAPRLIAAFGWAYLTFGGLATAAVATAVSWLHQVVTQRMTFALFRLYATAVTAGIGSVFGWVLGWFLLAQEKPHHGDAWLWALGMLTLVCGFGSAAYKGARGLRGEAPTTFTWISPEEFAGP